MTTTQLLNGLIFVLSFATYSSAILQVRGGMYAPSVFSRSIWFLLSVNSFAGVAFGGGSGSSKLLAGMLMLGNIGFLAATLKKGSREFGHTEKTSLTLFLLSSVLWIVSDAPLLNLALGLAAHFIGGIPTLRRAMRNPKSEQALHWYFFSVACVLTIINSHPKTVRTILFPVYFICFNTLMIALINRRRFIGRRA